MTCSVPSRMRHASSMCSKMEVRFTRVVRIYDARGRPASAHHGGALVNLKGRSSSLRPIESTGVAQPPFAETLSQRRIGGHGAEFARDVVRVVRVKDEGGVTDDFAERTAVRTHDGAAAGHRLDRRHSEPFVKRGVRASAGSMIQRGKFGIAHEAE